MARLDLLDLRDRLRANLLQARGGIRFVTENTYFKANQGTYVSKQTKYLEYVIRLGVAPEGKDGREAVEERQGGEGDLPPPVSSLSRKTWKYK